MQNEEAWIGVYYAGDCMVMMDNNEDLRFYLPENQGFNLFIDSMCIPTCCQEKDAAELFINFMCDPEISGANMDYICYGSPISEAKAYMEDYLAESEIVYPSEEVLSKGTSYAYLSEETSRFVEGLYQQATKTSEGTEEGSNPVVVWVITALIAVGAVALLTVGKKKKK